MANHKSAEKRHRQSLKRRDRNRHVKSTVRGLVKKIRESLALGELQNVPSALAQVSRRIDMAVQKGVFHRKTGSRYISRLTKQVNDAGKSA